MNKKQLIKELESRKRGAEANIKAATHSEDSAFQQGRIWEINNIISKLKQ